MVLCLNPKSDSFSLVNVIGLVYDCWKMFMYECSSLFLCKEAFDYEKCKKQWGLGFMMYGYSDWICQSVQSFPPAANDWQSIYTAKSRAEVKNCGQK